MLSCTANCISETRTKYSSFHLYCMHLNRCNMSSVYVTIYILQTPKRYRFPFGPLADVADASRLPQLSKAQL